MSRLKELRLSRGLTIEGLHELSKVSVGAISGIENGKIRNPGMVTLQKLAGALNTDIREIMPEMTGE